MKHLTKGEINKIISTFLNESGVYTSSAESALVAFKKCDKSVSLEITTQWINKVLFYQCSILKGGNEWIVGFATNDDIALAISYALADWILRKGVR